MGIRHNISNNKDTIIIKGFWISCMTHIKPQAESTDILISIINARKQDLVVLQIRIISYTMKFFGRIKQT